MQCWDKLQVISTLFLWVLFPFNFTVSQLLFRHVHPPVPTNRHLHTARHIHSWPTAAELSAQQQRHQFSVTTGESSESTLLACNTEKDNKKSEWNASGGRVHSPLSNHGFVFGSDGGTHKDTQTGQTWLRLWWGQWKPTRAERRVCRVYVTLLISLLFCSSVNDSSEFRMF